MLTYGPLPKLGGSASSNFGPFPDEIEYGVDYHPSSASKKYDLAVSAWRGVWDVGVRTEYFGSGTKIDTGCTGTTLDARYTWGNTGTKDITPYVPVEIRYYLSFDTSYGSSDIQVANSWHWGSVGHASTNLQPFDIPSNAVLNREYWVLVRIDPGNIYGESNESNNVARLNLKVKRTCN